MAKWIRNNKGFLVFILLFGLFRTAVADWNPIPSGSMRPTLLEGDVVLVNRLAFDLKVPLTDVVVAHLGEPKRGDIVTFSSPKDGVRLIKRLVAVPGDTVAMRNKVLVVNGQRATYAPIGTAVERLAPGTTVHALRFNEITGSGEHVVQWFHLPDGSEEDSFGPVVLPAGRYLMLGDNRDRGLGRYQGQLGAAPRTLRRAAALKARREGCF